MTPLQALIWSAAAPLASCLIKAHVPTLCLLRIYPQAGPSPPSPRTDLSYPEIQPLHRILAFQIWKPTLFKNLFPIVSTRIPDAPLYPKFNPHLGTCPSEAQFRSHLLFPNSRNPIPLRRGILSPQILEGLSWGRSSKDWGLGNCNTQAKCGGS